MKETVEIEIQQEKRKMYTRFLVTTGYGWGFGDSIKEAKIVCKTQTPRSLPNPHKPIHYIAKLVTQETTCDGSGGISYFPEYPPIELGEV
jgi:hypothetical protein